MVVYHVTTLRKLYKYVKSKQINPPVRAWINIEQAERMSLSSGRRIILRLKFPKNAPKLEGHFNQAVVCHQPIKIENY